MNIKTITFLECSRIFSLPMTIFSWLVIFIFGIINSGNLWYGLLAFIGLCFTHLGTNVFDDYLDYKYLIKQVNFDKSEYLKNSQKTKCRYLINGLLKETDVLLISCLYFLMASLCGLFLFLKCGVGVLYFALIGALIALLYPLLSRICLSEIAVALAYGPALFGGVYYVMTGTFSWQALILSIPTMLMTTILLFIHTVMDYEFDLNEGKRTVANLFNSQLDSLIILKILLILAYFSPIILCIFDILNWQVFLIYSTIPLACDLYKSMSDYTCNPNLVPTKKWYHYPMERFNTLLEKGEASFMMRMYQSRNLMIYFSIFYIIGILCSCAL